MTVGHIIIALIVVAAIYYSRDAIVAYVKTKRTLIPAQYAEWLEKWIDWCDVEEAYAKAEELGRTADQKRKIAVEYLQNTARSIGREMQEHAANFIVELIVSLKKQVAKA